MSPPYHAKRADRPFALGEQVLSVRVKLQFRDREVGWSQEGPDRETQHIGGEPEDPVQMSRRLHHEQPRGPVEVLLTISPALGLPLIFLWP